MTFLLSAAAACSAEPDVDERNVESAVPSPATTASSSTSAAREKVTVLFFGTSLTAGYGLDPAIAFPNLVARKAAQAGMPITAVNAGLSGETSAGAVRRIAWSMRQPVDIVVLETGGNDALRALNADSLETNLRAIVARIREAQPEARILLAVMEAPPNLGAGYTARFREAYGEVARDERLTLVPFLLDSVAGRAELNQADGVHPNERGERIVADNVWRALAPVVQEVYRRRQNG